MAECKACKAEIEFLKMPNGKKMPVDAQPVPYWCPAIGSVTTVVLEVPGHGRMVVGGKDGYPPIFKVYAPHWATCSDPDRFRKGKKK